MTSICAYAGTIAALALTASSPAIAQDVQASDLTLPAGSLSELVASGFLAPDDAAECPGRIAVVRFNRAQDGAALAQFLDAVSAHDAWMAGKGYGDVELVALTAEPLASAQDSVLFGTMQIYPSQARYREISDARSSDRDTAYDAFVALYDAATDGSAGFRACLQDVSSR